MKYKSKFFSPREKVIVAMVALEVINTFGDSYSLLSLGLIIKVHL